MSDNLDDLLEINSKSENPKASTDEPITTPRHALPFQNPKTDSKTDDTVECGNCGVDIPVTSNNCPKCGIQLYGNDVEQSLKHPSFTKPVSPPSKTKIANNTDHDASLDEGKDNLDFPKISPEDVEITYSPSRVTNYETLKTIAQILKGFTLITGLGGGVLIIASLNYFREPQFYIFLALGFTAFFIAILSSLFSESINVILDIEANSRQAAKTLERLLKSQ
ncbi:MAG: hypothetical protein HN741_11295 [Anaerolineae bacterium]|jgi:hypothetical protein|nr:hypothetical protein [Anaerolineae bacterium]